MGRCMRSIWIIGLILFVLVTVTAGSRVAYVAVTTEGRDIKIVWEMLDQEGIQFFNIERLVSGQDHYSRINGSPISPNGSKKYEYTDQSIYKQDSPIIFYRIAIVETNGTVHYSDPTPLGKISSVRRTWGSIKSMFR
jgi:hypothetical protein